MLPLVRAIRLNFVGISLRKCPWLLESASKCYLYKATILQVDVGKLQKRMSMNAKIQAAGQYYAQFVKRLKMMEAK